MNRLTYRKMVNNVMLTLTGLCTLFTVSILFLILGYLVYNGGKSLDWAFFTKLPLPPGEDGGGMANAIVGSAEMVALGGADRSADGFHGRHLPGRIQRQDHGFAIRYTADLLNGVPSIVIGIFAWALVVVPLHSFSGLAGAVALGHHADSHFDCAPPSSFFPRCRTLCGKAHSRWAPPSGRCWPRWWCRPP